ncbi:MAG: hypothetical protein FWC71_04260 [Defluviitaleaceae bacterium]|nr:hypothetical protein [Defluviitaleaceae bacterium]
MANIVHASSSLRIVGTDGRSVCSLLGVDPSMSPADAVGFIEGIEALYNGSTVTARISTLSEIERN